MCGGVGVGVNLCHPLLLLSRAGVELLWLPGLGAEFHVVLPVLRPSGPEERPPKVRG
jgi:hypothetical protein